MRLWYYEALQVGGPYVAVRRVLNQQKTDGDHGWVLCTDIKKSSALWSEDAEGMVRAMPMHNAIMEIAAERFGASITESSPEGDAYVLYWKGASGKDKHASTVPPSFRLTSPRCA